MTVHSGRGWKLAPSLIAMEAEADRIAPRRSRASDGSIGDAAHRARGSASDHNPEGGWVTALDLTHDPKNGWDAHARARQLAARRDPRIDYIISNRQIWDLQRGWRTYTGTNGHTAHAHFSIFNTPTARGVTDPFWPTSGAPSPPSTPTTPPVPEEYDMNPTLAQFKDGRIFLAAGNTRKLIRKPATVDWLRSAAGGSVPYYPWAGPKGELAGVMWAIIEDATVEVS